MYPPAGNIHGLAEVCTVPVLLVITTSTGTVHTCAKARLTSAAVWRISMNPLTTFRIFQVLIVMNPENNPCIQKVIRIATKIYSLVRWPIANLHRKCHANPFETFLAQSC